MFLNVRISYRAINCVCVCVWCLYVCRRIFHFRSDHPNGHPQRSQFFFYTNNTKPFKNILQKAEMLTMCGIQQRYWQHEMRGDQSTEEQGKCSNNTARRAQERRHLQAQDTQKQQMAIVREKHQCFTSVCQKGKPQEHKAVQEYGRKEEKFYKDLQKGLVTYYYIIRPITEWTLIKFQEESKRPCQHTHKATWKACIKKRKKSQKMRQE